MLSKKDSKNVSEDDMTGRLLCVFCLYLSQEKYWKSARKVRWIQNLKFGNHAIFPILALHSRKKGHSSESLHVRTLWS